MYIARKYEKALNDLAKSFPCIVVYGPRQVGKSTLVDHVFPADFNRVSLDKIDERTSAKENPRQFLEMHKTPLIIDEIQKVPELLDEIKVKIDDEKLNCMKKNKKINLMYVLTGSNRFELQEGISESLAGRCGILEINSFSQAEKYRMEGHLFNPSIDYLLDIENQCKYNYRDFNNIWEDIFIGGMPDVYLKNSEKEIFFKSYINTYIEKDVRRIIEASSEMQFRNFINILALRTSQELHYDEIANIVGIDTRTCKKWISILENSGIIYLLEPYMKNISNRIIKAPKIYFMDTGLCSYLCKWKDAKMLSECAMSGAFFETYVVSEIIKNLYAYNKEAKEYIYYYRDIDKKEIDLLYVESDSIYPIEIKKSESTKNPTKNFSVLNKYNMKIKNGLVIDTCEKILLLNDKNYQYPVFLLGG